MQSEILRNFDEYSKFSSDKVNILTELDRFLANSLQYCNCDTVDLFLIALGNTLRKMSPFSELFWSAFFPHFPASGRNTEKVSVRMRENAGKMRTRITPNTDTYTQ